MKCSECQRQVPLDLVAPFVSHLGSSSMCACCALRFRNDMHGLGHQPFDGHRAATMFNLAIAYFRETRQAITDFERSVELEQFNSARSKR